MDHRRSLSVVTTIAAAACVGLPIALTSYIGGHMAHIVFPSLQSSGSTPEFTATPITERKAKAVQQFKLMQA